MEMKFTDNDVTSFLTQLIELGQVDTVDSSPDKYIRRIATGKPETLTVEGKIFPLAVYGSRAADALIINPLSEGSADNTKNLWFYSTRNGILSKNIVAILLYLLEVGANSKKSKGEDISDIRATKYLSKYVHDIDDKTLDEFRRINNNPTEFFTIYFNKTTRMGEVRCIVFAKEQRKTFDVRVKTWKMLEGLTLDILDAHSLSDFNYQTDNLSSVPVFDSFANILVMVYSHIEDALKLIGIDQNVEPLKSHLKYVQEYSRLAEWCKSPTGLPAQNANVPVPMAPWGVPAPAAAVPVPMAAIPMPGTIGMIPQPMLGMPGQIPYPPTAVGVPMPGMAPMINGIPAPMSQLQLPAAPAAPDNSYAKATGNPFARR